VTDGERSHAIAESLRQLKSESLDGVSTGRVLAKLGMHESYGKIPRQDVFELAHMIDRFQCECVGTQSGGGIIWRCRECGVVWEMRTNALPACCPGCKGECRHAIEQ
jgi:hypothetical protein